MAESELNQENDNNFTTYTENLQKDREKSFKKDPKNIVESDFSGLWIFSFVNFFQNDFAG